LIDFLIIGQGLAGTLLANELLKQNKTIKIVDAIDYDYSFKKVNNFTIVKYTQHPFNAATFSSTGIINPITGRRFVKSWLLEALLPIAFDTYKSFEKQFNQKFLSKVKIFRTIPDQRAANDLALRINDPDYQSYFETENEILPDPKIFNIIKRGVIIKKAALVSIMALVRCFRAYFIEHNLFIKENIQVDDIKINSNQTFTLKKETYQNLIFSEGYRVNQNPYFKDIPFTATNGQIVIIKCNQLKMDYLLKSGVFIIPLNKNLFKIGTTWDLDLKQPQTTETAINFFKKHLNELLKIPYEIVAHQAAVRPTVKDRRPVLGEHPIYKNMYLFNGLGAKGVSLGPYFSKHLLAHILENQNLIKAVDLNRFLKQS